MSRVFAEQYGRDEKGRILFPHDTQLRRKLFPYTDPAEHVAKANMLAVEELVLYVSEEGETILDPFGGTGTIMVAATHNRKVIMIELVDTFVDTIGLNLIGIKQTYPAAEDLTVLIPGDAASVLPIKDFCNHAIFSPPYPMGLKKKGAMDKTSKDLGYTHAAEYSEDMRNFTNLNTFMYHQKVEQFYKKVYDSLTAGGTMTIIIKDHMEGGKRLMQAERTIRDCERIGFVTEERFQWYARGGGYSAINRAAGLDTVDEEDLIVFRKVA